jgi:hypothetical protein
MMLLVDATCMMLLVDATCMMLLVDATCLMLLVDATCPPMPALPHLSRHKFIQSVAGKPRA